MLTHHTTKSTKYGQLQSTIFFYHYLETNKNLRSIVKIKAKKPCKKKPITHGVCKQGRKQFGACKR